VLYIFMPKPSLNCSGIMTGIGQSEAAPVSKHMRMDLEGHRGAATNTTKQSMESLGRHGSPSLAYKHIGFAAPSLFPL
jgi:hypothetical protein